MTPTHFKHCGLAAWVMVASATPCAAQSPVNQPLPEQFGLQPQNELVAVAYARIETLTPHGVHRKTVEDLCSARRELGQSTATPVFTPGWDEPIRSESRRYLAQGLWANHSVSTAYVCLQRAADATGHYDPCACTYGYRQERRSQIKRVQDGQVENITMDHERGTGRRVVTRGPKLPPNLAETDVDLAMAGAQVAGQEQLLGMACTLYRKNLPQGGWTEWCLTAKDDDRLHPQLRGTSLRSATYGKEGKAGAMLGSRTLEVAPQAWVDRAVFTVPSSIKFKTVNPNVGGANP